MPGISGISDELSTLLVRAREKAASERQRLMEEAREEVEDTKSKWYDALEREKATFLQELRQRAGRQVYHITRQALEDLASADLEQQIVDAFCRRLQDLSEEKRKELRSILQSGNEATITSAFELPTEARKKIEDILKGYVQDGLNLSYQTSPEVVSGIELKAPGHKIAWSLYHYLEALEAETRQMLEERISG